MHILLLLLSTPIHPLEKKYNIASVWSIVRLPIITHKLKIGCSDSTDSLTFIKYSTPPTGQNSALRLSGLLLDYLLLLTN